MPAATTRPCTVCDAPSSRYNCPRRPCNASTCSLACSKSHRFAAHPESTKVASGSMPTGAHGAKNEDLSTPLAPSSKEQPTQYVPLASYTEQHFINDFHFLTRMGAYVSGKGKELAKQRLLPPELLSSGHTGGAQGKGGAQGAAPVRLSNEQHKKEALRKQIAYRRVGIMLLPEGMERRRLNQSMLLKRNNVLVYTVSLEFPLAEASSSRCLLHRVLPDATGWTLLHAELSKRSGSAASKAAPQSLSKRERKRRRNGQPVSSVEGPAEPTTSTPISDTAWRSVGLKPPPESGSDQNADTTPPTHADLLLLVPLHNFRLRNESSQRFLEWYARQKERGLDPDAPLADEPHGPEDEWSAVDVPHASRADASASGTNGLPLGPRGWGKKADREGSGDARGRGGMSAGRAGSTAGLPTPAQGLRTWGTSMQTPHTWVSQAGPIPVVQAPRPTPAPLVAPHILSMLSSLKGKESAVPQAIREVPSINASAAAPMTFTEEDPAPTLPPSPTSPSDDTASRPPARTYLRLPHHLPLEEALQRLPEGYAVIEFPSIQVWSAPEVARRRKEDAGWTLLDIRTEGEEARLTEVEAEESSEEESEEDESASAESRPPSPPQKIVRPLAPLEQAQPTANMASLLGGYDSETSDASSAGENHKKARHARLDEEARKDLFEEDGEQHTAGGGGLAALAVSLGFRSASAPSGERREVSPALSSVFDEEEVDWDDEDAS